MEMWCLDDIGRDSWDLVGPLAWGRACFISPECGGGSSPVKTEPPQIVLLLLFLFLCLLLFVVVRFFFVFVVVRCCSLLFVVVRCCSLLFVVVVVVVVRCCSLLFVVVRCCSLLFVVVRCCSLLFVVVRCCSLLFVVVRCCLLLFVVVCCCSLLFVVVCCCLLLFVVVVVVCCLLLFVVSVAGVQHRVYVHSNGGLIVHTCGRSPRRRDFQRPRHLPHRIKHGKNSSQAILQQRSSVCQMQRARKYNVQIASAMNSGHACNRSIDNAHFSMLQRRQNHTGEQDVNRPQDPSLLQHVEKTGKSSPRTVKAHVSTVEPSIAQEETSQRGNVKVVSRFPCANCAGINIK